MIEIAVDGLEVQVWSSPSTTMPADLQASLRRDLSDLGRDGFAAFASVATDDDLAAHYLETTVAAYLFEGGRCRAVFTADPIVLPTERALYLSGAMVHSDLRGRGLYQPMILLRLALGQRWSCRWWAARTQNPLVAQLLRRFSPYPWHVDGEGARRVATDTARVLFSRFGVGQAQPGQTFDVATGVLGRAYPMSPYDELPRGAAPVVSTYFAEHVDHGRGDALLLMGGLDDAIDRLAPRCDEFFGVSFEHLAGRLARL